MLESVLRDRMRDFDYFPETTVLFIEKRFDTPDGQPDIAVKLDTGLFIPIELKEGTEPIKNMRPSQRKWFKKNILNGGSPLLSTVFTEGGIDYVWIISLDFHLGVTGREKMLLEDCNYKEYISRIKSLPIALTK